VLGEVINAGILFQFPHQESIQFVTGNAHRLKSIYTDFDQIVYNYLVRHIEKKLKDDFHSLFNAFSTNTAFKKYIGTAILPEDATVLQFQDPVTVKIPRENSGHFIKEVIDEFSALLLPGVIIRKPEIIRHNEYFLIKRFTGYVFEKHKELEEKFIKNTILKTTVQDRDIELKFDLSWQNGTTNLIKPLNFDVAEEKTIQDKSLFHFGYLSLLEDYARQENLRFDFIVSTPQNKELFSAYENALGLLELSKAPKKIITERQIKQYSEEAIEVLRES
jgi:hypothetical protein